MRQLKALIWENAYVLLTCVALFWAGNSVVGRAARDLVPPVTLAFWRWSLALIILIPLAWPYFKKDWPVIRQHLPFMTLLGALGIGCFNTLLYLGLQTTTAVNGTLLQAFQPALILLFGFALTQTLPTVRQLIGMPISFVGVLLIVAAGDLRHLLSLHLVIGDLIIAGGVVLWSIYAVLLTKRPDIHPLSFLLFTLIVGVICLAPFYGLDLAQGRLIVATPDSFLAIAYVAVFPSFLAYLFYNQSISLIGPAAAAQYLNILPIMGAGMAVLFLGEAFHRYHLMSLALIALGILIAGKRAQTQNDASIATAVSQKDGHTAKTNPLCKTHSRKSISLH